MWDATWEVPPGARRGIPAFRETISLSRDLWQALAILGGIGLLVEWLLFGRAEGRMRRLKARVAVLRPGVKKAS
jgi:hypothetical protein